jgi:hypothetical protein
MPLQAACGGEASSLCSPDIIAKLALCFGAAGLGGGASRSVVDSSEQQKAAAEHAELTEGRGNFSSGVSANSGSFPRVPRLLFHDDRNHQLECPGTVTWQSELQSFFLVVPSAFLRR